MSEVSSSSPRYGLRAALVVVVAGVVYALVARFALREFPFSGDEYSYLLQAEGFARGVLKAPAPPFADWVAVDHVVIDQFVRTKYPPGTSALLALGVIGGAPWLVTPIEAVLTLIVAWLASRLLLGPRRAFLATVFLAATPLFAYQAATYFSHTATLLFVSLATLAVVLRERSRNDAWLVLFGLAVGAMFLIRPLDAVLVGVALIALGSARAVVVGAVSALPGVALSLWYDKLQFGSPFTDGYEAYKPAFKLIYGPEGAVPNISLLYAFEPSQIWNHLAVLETLIGEWTVPGAVLVATIGLVLLGKSPRGELRGDPVGTVNRFFTLLIALYVGMLFVTFIEVDDGPRCRYLSALLIPLAFFAAAGWDQASKLVVEWLGPRRAWVAGVAMWIAPLFLIASYLEHRVPAVVVRSGLNDAIAEAHIDSGEVLVRAEWPTRYARNGMFFDRRPLLLSAGPSVTPDDVERRFPGQPVYEASEPHGDNPWKHGWVVKRVR